MPRKLYLLSPYRLPGRYSLMLNAGDAAILLNGYLALWHPSALAGSVGPPKFASPYDHEAPLPEAIYALPENPPLFLPDDWEKRAADAGARFFRATPDRQQTLANLHDALGTGTGWGADAEALSTAIGFGYILLDTLFEAMDHLPQLNVPEFWNDVTNGLSTEDAEERRRHFAAAAEKLREARDILYPSPIQIVELALAEDYPPDGPWPPALERQLPVTFIASGEMLERWAKEYPQRAQMLRELSAKGVAELCVGPYRERDDGLLPIESQLWNLQRGVQAYRDVMLQEPLVYARRRFAGLPESPQLLVGCGFKRAVQIPFDEGTIPKYQSAIIEWSSQDGARLETFALKPYPAESPLTWFHIAHYFSRTMQQDATPALAFRHSRHPGVPPCSYYADWLTLNQLAPVFGQMVTLSEFFSQGVIGDYPPAAGVDDYGSNYLEELTNAHDPHPVSRFAEFARRRCEVEAAWTLCAVLRGLVPAADVEKLVERLRAAEAALELERATDPSHQSSLAAPPEISSEVGRLLAEVLLSRAESATPGHLLFNPCSFPRKVGVELSGVQTPLPAPAKATQMVGGHAQVVVEVPAFGFAWLPNEVRPGTPVAMPRGRIAEERVLRNEFLEAEVDPSSGGLRTIRRNRLGGGRLGQQLCFGPGSEMQVREIKVTSAGPALGEIVSHGVLLDGQRNVLAEFRQRFRLWWGRPLLELRLELEPREALVGYPWHAAYSARFAWRDPNAVLSRAVGFVAHSTSNQRPETPHYLEVQSGIAGGRTAILTGGLPFLQRHSGRMVDVILIPEGETCQRFDLAIGLDLDEPMAAAIEWISPMTAVPVAKGPPHVGAAGWLFHLDAANVLVTSMRPAEDRSDAVVVRLLECRGLPTKAELRCARNPARAVVVDEFDRSIAELPVSGDAVALEFTAGQMLRVRIEFA